MRLKTWREEFCKSCKSQEKNWLNLLDKYDECHKTATITKLKA